MHIETLSTNLGAEIFNADIRDKTQFDAIWEAFKEYSVLVIRNQAIIPEEHLEFSRQFGQINVNRFFQPLENQPEISVVEKLANQRRAIGQDWHTDHSYDAAPAMGSIMHAIALPPYGGDTLFVSMASAFEALNDEKQLFLKGLSAIHSSKHVFGKQKQSKYRDDSGRTGNEELAIQDALHPVVITHPLSGRDGLYVNPTFTESVTGVSSKESETILGALYRHCQSPNFQCRIKWKTGDVGVWDNRATWHKAENNYHGHYRLMHRITIEGCTLSGSKSLAQVP